jgi:hypothetical protein
VSCWRADRELDVMLGLTDMAHDALKDNRAGGNKRHGLSPLLRRSLYGRLTGCDDVNDAGVRGITKKNSLHARHVRGRRCYNRGHCESNSTPGSVPRGNAGSNHNQLQRRPFVKPTIVAVRLLWFTLGLSVALGITLVCGWISFDLVDRGPVIVRDEWGIRHRAHDRILNTLTGLVIALIGWIVGITGLHYRFPRALAIGLVAGSTLLGIFFALLLL